MVVLSSTQGLWQMTHSLRGVDPIGLDSLAARGLRVLDPEGPARPLGAGQGRVGLVLVPDVGVGPPGPLLEVEDLRLDPAPALRVPAFEFDRDRPGEDRPLGGLPPPRAIDDDPAGRGWPTIARRAARSDHIPALIE